MSHRYAGTVLSFDNMKGSGYLSCPGRANVLCHYSAIQRPFYRTLMEGEAVEFDIVQGLQKEEASNVTVLSSADENTGTGTPSGS